MNELYDLPDGWEWKEWRDIVIIKNGKDYKAVLNENGKYPIYGSGGIMNYSDEYLCNENSVVIGRKGTINNPLFVREKFWNIDTAFGLEAKKEVLEPLFLYYFCLSYNFLQLNTSTTLPSLTKSNLQTIEIPLPPLLEQQRIVLKLDSLFEKIDKSIELHQKNIDEANAFMGSVLNEIFEELEEKYSKKHLKDIVSKLGDGLHGTPKYDEAGEYYFINGANVSDNKIVVNQNTKKVNEEEYHKYKKELNDKTIFVSINGTLGNIGLYDNEKCILGKSACYFNLLDNIDKIYITYVLKNQDFQQYIRENATGATIKNVSLKTMREYNVVLPPLSIQQKVVNYLDSVSEKTEMLKRVQHDKMESLKALKASILDKAFQGEL